MPITRKIFSDSAFTTLRYVFGIGRNIIVISLITKLLGADMYGSWVSIIAAVGLLSATAETHLHGSLIRYTPQENKVNQTYSDILSLSIIFGCMIAVTVLLFGYFVDISQYLETQLLNESSLVVVLSALIFSEVVFLININYPRAQGNARMYDFSIITRSILEGVLLLLIFSKGGGILDGLIVMLAVTSMFNVGAFGIIAKSSNIPWSDTTNFRKNLQFAIPLLPQQLSSRLIRDTDKFLLLLILGPKMVGIYAVADAVSNPMRQFSSILNPSLYPTVTGAWEEENYSEIIQMYTLIFRYFFLIGIPGIVGLILLSDSLMTLISTAEIATEGLYVVPVLVLAYFFSGLDSNLRYILTSAEKTYILGLLLILAIVINIVINLILIPRIGIIGAAVGTLSSYLVLFLSVFHFSIAAIPTHTRKIDMIPLKAVQRSIFAASIMAVSLYFIDQHIAVLPSLIILPVFGASLYFAVLFLIGGFTKNEINYATNLLRL